MLAGKETLKKVKKVWRKKNNYSHCNKGGHHKSTCWKLHPELRPKKDWEHMKAHVKEPTDEAIQQGIQLQEESPLAWLPKKWVAFLSS